jgi:hypothetical protein
MPEKSKWQKLKEGILPDGPNVFDLLNPNTEWAEDAIADERLRLCIECPELIQITKNCKKCGCFMTAKTKINSATCPLGKW